MGTSFKITTLLKSYSKRDCTDDRKIKGTASPSFDVWSKSKETSKKRTSQNIRFVRTAQSVVQSTRSLVASIEKKWF